MAIERSVPDIGRSISLVDVRLHECQVVNRLRSDERNLAVEVGLLMGATVSRKGNDWVEVHTTVEVHGFTKDIPNPELGKTDPSVMIRAVHELKCGVPREILSTISDGALSDLANASGVLLVWPYARHFIHDISAQMRMPPILLPIMSVTFTGGSGRVVVAGGSDESTDERFGR